MASISRVGPKLAVCGVVAGLILVCWAARYSAAQNAGQDVPPPVDQGPGSTVKGEESKSPAPQPKPETQSDAAAPLPAPGPADRLSVPHLNSEPDAGPFTGKTSDKAPAPVTVAPGDAAAETDDPEKVATAFVDQNQKLAETHLKTLKDEAEKLRARLTKVEAGIKRWDRLLEALKQSRNAELTARSPVQHNPARDESAPAIPSAGADAPSLGEARRLPPDDTVRDVIAPSEPPKSPDSSSAQPPK
jgi:hypothetical protein